MVRIKEAVIVEGRYDKNTVSQAVSCLLVETQGFGIFSQKDKLRLIRRLAEEQGVIILTDSDSAGFLIRSHIKGALPKGKVKHAYIPDMRGKERRKSAPSKEGKLGVEGMSAGVIIDALRRAGATFLDEEPPVSPEGTLTKADLYELGLTGRSDSGEKRKALLKRMDLPERLTTNGLLEILNALYTPEEVCDIVQTLS